MDRALTQTIDAKIREYAEGVPRSQRKDFAQDMWVRLLAIDPQLPSGSGLGSFLSITLFRARENWLAHERFRERGQAEFEAEAGPEPVVPPADVLLEVEEALAELIASLRESLSEDDIKVVVEGLRDGLTQKDIALSLGRTPQGLNYHFKKFRFAA